MNLIATKLFMTSLLIVAALQGAQAETPMRPDKAFRYTADASSSEIVVSWDIEPGYYLYKKRMSFESSDPSVQLQKPIFPKGETHEDEFFGKSEIFRNQADVRIPYTGNNSQPFDLIIKSQGCADMGLCYPPQRWATSVQLPSDSSARQAGLPDFIQTNPKDSEQPLPAAEAFVVSATAIDAFNIEIRWNIADGYYIYKDQIVTTILSNNAVAGVLQLPRGTAVDDLEYGMTEVYYGDVVARIPLSRASPIADLIELELGFQGCKENSICYPPQTVVLPIDMPAGSAADEIRTAKEPAPVSEQSRLATMIAEGNLAAVMSVFLGLGLLLAFTPCVLPMVPILSGIIAGQGENITTLRAFLLSLTYVLGMAVTYTLAGALFAAAGQQVQALLQQAWIIVAVSLLFIALAAAMFGFLTLQLPSGLQTKINSFSNQQKAGTYIGTAIMGALSALVVTTCVAPPLVATLTVIAETGDVIRGGSALFALSIGMGFPLLVIGTSAGKLIPKAGAWMDAVKELFGFMMLGLAVWMLERLLPGSITMVLWGVLAVAFAMRLRSLSKNFSAAAKALSAIATLLVATYALLIFVAASMGGSNPLQVIETISNTEKRLLRFETIKTSADLDAQLEIAAEEHKFVMLDFYADWCVSCKEMEHYTFTDLGVQNALRSTIVLQADVTANDSDDQELLKRMGIFGPPTIIFFDQRGNEIEGQRVIGFQSAEIFREHLERTLRQ